MPSSNVAKFLINQYLRTWDPAYKSFSSSSSSSSSHRILARFIAIAEELRDNRTALTNNESIISWLYDLNDILCDLQRGKDQNKLRFFCYSRGYITLSIETRTGSPVAAFSTTGQHGGINDRLSRLQDSLPKLLKASSIQPNLLHLDRYTFYKPDPNDDAHDDVSDDDEHGKVLLDWLLTQPAEAGEFKAAGIYGTGGSCETALVKNVLKQKIVRDKFERIIWACLSSQSMAETEDVRIMEYLLYLLGLDTDSLVGKAHENKDWLLEEVERRLVKSGNYILVLDGMWCCSKWFTDDFLGKLNENGGGAVIVTSRRRTVVERICSKSKNNKLIHLKPLDCKESAAFFDLGNKSFSPM